MERIGGIQVLLVNDHLKDGDKVRGFLDWLEDLKTIKTVTRMNMALGFFSDEEEEPDAIIMYMNCQTAIGIYLSDNHHLLSMEQFGVSRMKGVRRLQVNGPGLVKSCLPDFICSLAMIKTEPKHLMN